MGLTPDRPTAAIRRDAVASGVPLRRADYSATEWQRLTGIVPWWKVWGNSTNTAHLSFARRMAMLTHFRMIGADDDA